MYNMENAILSVSYIGLSVVQSYCFSNATDPNTYKVNPIVQFCFTSFCVALYAFVMFLKENENCLIKTFNKIASVDITTTIQILTWDALADVLNTFPKCCPNLNYSQHAVIEKSDIFISLLYAIFVRKNVKISDYTSTFFTLIGVGIYFRNILMSGSFTTILLSGITLMIALSKLSLEQAILVEGKVVRMKIISDSHMLFLTNIMAPISFLILLNIISPFSQSIQILKESILLNFYELKSLFLTVTMVAIVNIPVRTTLLSFFKIGFVHAIIYKIYLAFNDDKFQLYAYLCIGSIAWISIMSVKLKCHAKNFSGIAFSLFSTIVFAYKVTLKANYLYDYNLLATILFIASGAFVKINNK